MMKKVALLISAISVVAIASPAKALYNFTASTGGTVNPTGTFVPGSNTDDAVFVITAPFNFSIYSTNITAGQNITVSTNGNIQFVSSGGASSLNNSALRTTSMPNVPTVFAFWDDLLLTTSGGGIYTNTSGSVGSRVFDIEWRGEIWTASAGSVQNLNFEVRFFENSNSFQIVYGQTGIGGGANGASATVGVQAGNTAPSAFTQYSLNQANITPGLTLTATPIPFAFSPVTAFAFIGANIARRKARAKAAKVMQSVESI